MGRAGAALSRGAFVVSVSKGLEPERLTTLSCVLGEVLPRGVPVAVLSGPSFAQEVYQQQPTAVVAAAQDHGVASGCSRCSRRTTSGCTRTPTCSGWSWAGRS